MLNRHQLHKFTPSELLFLQKHLRLGKNHLEKSLSKEDIETLFHIASLPSGAEQEISIDKTEVASQTTLLINTMMTAILGAWMGVSGFFDLSLSSKPVFFTVLSFSVFLGTSVSLLSAYLRKRRSNGAREKRKIQDLDIAILKEVSENRKKEIEEKSAALSSLLSQLQLHQPNLDSLIENFPATCLGWIEQIEQRSPALANKLKELKKPLQEKTDREAKKEADTERLAQIVKRLAHAPIEPPVLPSWIKANIGSLIIGLIPTLFGGFSSLFVYLGGAPNLAKQWGNEALFNFLLTPEVKFVESLLAVGITAYFAFSFIYLSKKDFQRDQELYKLSVYITRGDSEMDALDDRLFKIKEALSLAQHIKIIT